MVSRNNRDKNHFEDMVEELIKELGPLTSKEIAQSLAEEEMLLVVIDPEHVYHHEDGEVEIHTVENNLRAVSEKSVENRLNKAWFLYQDDSGRWHLGV